jgi:probable HAF family extracellular repeat protein
MKHALNLFFVVAVLGAGTIYNVTDLGNLGGAYASAFGLNQEGQAVGAATDTRGNVRALLFNTNGITNLTPNQGAAFGINGSGAIVGAEYVQGQSYATVWQDGSKQHVAGAGSYATAINENGDVAGMLTTNNGGHAFVTRDGQVTILGTPQGSQWSSAYAINNSGEAAGYSQVGSRFEAMTWSPQGNPTILGGLGGQNSYAMGLNDVGEVVGHAQVANGYMHAFLWNGLAMQDFGTLGGSSSYAYGINDDGQAVGYSTLSDGANHAFLFSNGVLLDLNSLIGAGSGWTLDAAYAVNNAGQIVGTGLLNGIEHAFRLDPAPSALVSVDAFQSSETLSAPAAAPEPGTWLLMLGGLAGIVILRTSAVKFPPPSRLPAHRQDRLQAHR